MAAAPLSLWRCPRGTLRSGRDLTAAHDEGGSAWLQCQLTQVNQLVAIYGADVIYTISSTNG